MANETLPEMAIVGPGATDDVTPLLDAPPANSAEDMLKLVGPVFEDFSYHFYPKLSERCGSTEGPEIALTDDFLSRV